MNGFKRALKSWVRPLFLWVLIWKICIDGVEFLLQSGPVKILIPFASSVKILSVLAISMSVFLLVFFYLLLDFL